MRVFASSLSVTVAAAFLTGCAAIPSSPGQSLTSTYFLPSQQLRKPKSSARLYVAAQKNNEVLIYPESSYYHSPIGKITSGVSAPYGLYRDSAGNLYVANQGSTSVTVYAPGSTQPSTTYTQDLVDPTFMIVDAAGDLFVGNSLSGKSCNGGTVVEYQPGSTNAYQVLSLPGYEADGMDFDQQGNLYVAYRVCGKKEVGDIEEFAPGSSQGKRLGIRDHYPGGLIVDSQGNILEVEAAQWNAVSFIKPGKKYPTFRLKLPGGEVPVDIALTSDQSKLFVSTGDYVYETNYPITASSTWTPVDSVSGAGTGIALSNGQTF